MRTGKNKTTHKILKLLHHPRSPNKYLDIYSKKKNISILL